MHGGVKFYRGAAKAARAYVEHDRSRADDYYLAEGTGVAERLTATPDGRRARGLDGRRHLRAVGRRDRRRHRSQEGAAAQRRERAAVRRGHRQRTQDLVARGRAAPGDLGRAGRRPGQGGRARSSAGSPSTRPPASGRAAARCRCRSSRIEAAVIRHYTSRAGDPHRHLHLQINARVFAAGAWRGLHSVGVRDSDRGDQRHRARRGRDRPGVPGGRSPRTGSPSTPRPSEIRELAPYVGAFSARTAQIRRNIDRYEAEWRSEHPGEEPGPRLRRGVGPAGVGRGPARQGRPDATVRELVERWNEELRELGYRDPAEAVAADGARGRDGSTATPQPSWSSPSSGRSGRPGTPPTSAGRPRSCSRRPAWSPTRRSGSSWPRTSPPAPPTGAPAARPEPTCPSTSGR